MKLWKYLKGSVLISVKGFSRERFINLLAANNIFAWDIQNRSGDLRLRLTVDGLRKIKPLLKKTGCRFRIISKHGLPFTLYKYRHRGFFAAGFAAFFILMLFMSQFIWLIEIDGNSAVTDTELLEFFEKQGIYIGMNKHKIDVDVLKNSIIESYPQISWVSITQNGTRLLIDLSENVKNTEILDYSVPCDIISIRDCVVADIIAQNGTPAVKAGDTVKKGDVLISAAFDTLDENGLPAQLAPVHSLGQVRGKWRQELTLDLPYRHTVKEYTGNYRSLYSITFFGRTFNTDFLKTGTKFKKYDIIKRKKQLGFGPELPLPIVINKTVLCEYSTRELFYTPEQAEKRAGIMINRRLINDFAYTAEILEKSVEYTHDGNKLSAAVKLLVEDDIGKEKIYDTQEQ